MGKVKLVLPYHLDEEINHVMPLRKIITLYSSPNGNIGAQKWEKLYCNCSLLILHLLYSNFHVKGITCMLTITRKTRALLPLDNLMPKALPQQLSWHYLCRGDSQHLLCCFLHQPPPQACWGVVSETWKTAFSYILTLRWESPNQSQHSEKRVICNKMR